MTLPAQTLDLANWKLTLPIGVEANKPTEVKQPRLAGYSHASYFTVLGDGVLFRAPVNGVTTSGSANPRSELREMNSDGSNASWSSTDGKTHTLIIDQAITHLPNARTDGGVAGVVAGQIHDASDDICVFRLEGTLLWLTNGDNTHYKLIDAHYELGTRFQAAFRVHADTVDVYYNGLIVSSIPRAFSGGYFKAGAYTQANGKNSQPDNVSNYGEVVVYGLTVSHGAAIPIPVPGTVPTPTPVPVPTTGPVIMIIRHGEKDDNADGKDDVSHGLSKRGQQRALAIRDRGLFITPRADLAVPTYVLASQGGRMEQTAKPTADKLKLPIDVSLDVETAIDATAKLLVAKAKAGHNVWAVVEHKGIPALLKATAKLVGCTDKLPSSHADADFHTGYKFTGTRFITFQESVLPGDPGYVAVPPVVTPPPPPPAPQFPDAAWWARYAPKGSPAWAAILAAVAAVLIGAGVACGADCLPGSEPAPPPPAPHGRAYPVHTGVVSTTFWVGEIFDANRPDGSQVCSTYDSQWAAHWSGGVKTGTAGSGTDCEGSPTGGCDGVPAVNKCDTEARKADNGYFPTSSAVTPKENPFYLDLPYDDINNPAAFKDRCQVVPWANDPGYAGHCTDQNFSYMKDRWVKIMANGQTCYGQIEDAGPGTYHDVAYVFGTTNAKPANREFNSAGMDVSPALTGCLGFKELDGENNVVSWQFVDQPPVGPWTKVVTTSGVTP